MAEHAMNDVLEQSPREQSGYKHERIGEHNDDRKSRPPHSQCSVGIASKDLASSQGEH
jgi:hypothetical protein